MVRKRCEICNGESFSSAERGIWICPYCGCDLTREPVLEGVPAL